MVKYRANVNFEDRAMSDENNITADLSAAWDTVEESADETIQANNDTGDSKADIDSGSAGLKTDDTGTVRSAKAKSTRLSTNDTKDSQPDTGRDPDSGQKAADPIVASGKENTVAETPDLETPPISLPADAREVWKDTPLAMKQAMARREADYAKGIEKYRENANRAVQMDSVLNRYQPYFSMTGAHPGQTVDTLLRTVSNLTMGNEDQRADTMASLIDQFKVPIDKLDDRLSRNYVPRGTQEPDINQLVQQGIAQAMNPYVQQIEQQRAQERNRQAQAIGSELQQFAASHEFYNDVASEMADYLDVLASQNKQMPLDEVYERVCWANPVIRNIRNMRDRTPTQQQTRAASTLRGSGLGGEGDVQQHDTLRAAIEAAFDNVGRS
jgi:hypothetical protein